MMCDGVDIVLWSSELTAVGVASCTQLLNSDRCDMIVILEESWKSWADVLLH